MSFSRISVLALAAIGLAATAPRANAAYIITINQVGNDVVATGSGSIDTADLTGPNSASWSGMVMPSAGGVWVGSQSGTAVWSGIIGPQSIGPGGRTVASSNSGELTGIFGQPHVLYVPTGYISNSTLSGTSTWSNTTITNLGLTSGTYIWTWGSGADADAFTVNVAAVPEPASFAVVMLPATLALVRRKRHTA